jgi:hypothetical protein
MSLHDSQPPVVIKVRLTTTGEVNELIFPRHPKDQNPHSIALLDTPANRKVAANRDDNVPLCSPKDLVRAAVDHWETQCDGIRHFREAELIVPYFLASLGRVESTVVVDEGATA